MDRFCLGVVLGALLACWLTALPTPAITALLTICWAVAGRRFALPCGTVAFLTALSWHQQLQIAQQQQLPTQNNTEICFSVQTLPRQFGETVQFAGELLADCQGTAQQHAGRLLQFSGELNTPTVPYKAGQHWQAKIRFKSWYGPDNFGLPERARHLLVQGISARVAFSDSQLLVDTPDFRQRLADRIQDCCRNYRSMPLWLALTLGERPFTDELWYGVQASGLAHLLSISGMHISWLFASVLLVLQWVSQPSRWRRQLLMGATLLAACLAWGYALLAGMAVPTQRAVLALTLVLLLQLLHRRYSIWQLGWLLSASMLLAWPYWMFSYSFWLSLIALLVLALLNWRYPTAKGWRGACWQFVRFQYGFSLLLLPITLLLFGGVAPLALPVNLLVVPLVTFLMMPLLALLFLIILSGFAVPVLLAQLIELISWPLYWLLQQLAAPAFWWAWPDVPWLVIILFTFALLLCWLPLGWRRLFAVPLLLPLWASLQKPVKPIFFLLDVGQGSSAVLQQGHQAMVFDLGPAYGPWNATQQQLLPFLRSRGIRQITQVVISHDDSDHSGFWPVLNSHYPSAQLVSDIRRLAPRYHCGWAWQAGEVVVQTFRAGRYQPEPDNEDSCAVKLSYFGQHILLPGDVGQREMAVAAWSGVAQVLVLGHHGSKHSSSLQFLQQIKPQLALNSAGIQNRFGHPAKQTLTRLSMLPVPVYSTSQHGAIRLDWQQHGWQITTSRAARPGRWVEKTLFPAETVALNR